ncbi:IQ motif, EF-hand binding site [Phytophthora cactorum]|nr:IQ motif, EF-hand binding site [Phytophthora cactorum]
MPAHPGQKTEQSSLQHVTENELPMESMPVSSLAAESLPQQTTPQYPQPDALQVQRSVICMQKYVRGFMVRSAAVRFSPTRKNAANRSCALGTEEIL